MTSEQTLAEAVEFLVREAMRERITKTAYPKIVKALWCLGLRGDEVGRILYVMEYANSNGEPWPWIFAKRTR